MMQRFHSDVTEILLWTGTKCRSETRLAQWLPLGDLSNLLTRAQQRRRQQR